MVCNKEDSRLEETENIKKISKIIKKLFALNNTTFFELSNITKKPINTRKPTLNTKKTSPKSKRITLKHYLASTHKSATPHEEKSLSDTISTFPCKPGAISKDLVTSYTLGIDLSEECRSTSE